MDDLIYTDKNRIEKGVLITYELDIDMTDTKDFEIKTHELVMNVGSYWYIDGTEYGGVVDSAFRNTKTEITTLSGRNFRGMLASQFIERDTITAVGNIADCINDLLVECKIDALFTCDSPDVADDVDVDVDYTIQGYSNLYDAIILTAQSINFNLLFRYSVPDAKVHITPVLTEDWSDYLNYCDENSVGLDIGEKQGVNHLLCIGLDENNKRKQIHLFTNENGGIQPYATTEKPVKDSDYILDKSEQVLIGLDEYMELLDVGECQPVDNYVLLTTKPSDWATNSPSYFEIEIDEDDGNIRYYNVEEELNSSYTALTSQPEDWVKGYGNYYTLSGGNYSEVTPATVVIGYTQVTAYPSNWALAYGEYKTRRWDGTQWIYENYGAKNVKSDKKQTKKPTDWDKNYNTYFKIKKKKYVAVEGTGKKGKTAPKWSKNKYYTQYTTSYAPTFISSNTWKEITGETNPAFVSGAYYRRTDTYSAPPFVKEKYYKMELDYYAKIVAEGIEYLQENSATNEQDVTLDDFPVNIGDTVGGVDDVTGLIICEQVSNIIVKIEGGVITNEYIIGGKNQ